MEMKQLENNQNKKDIKERNEKIFYFYIMKNPTYILSTTTS